MWAKIVLIYGLFVIIVVLVSVNKSSAYPTGPWAVAVDPHLFQTIEELSRIEREIDLRQNLHKHIKPFALNSPLNLKRPKPVEKPITPYFVRILKRRPGSSSRESAEDDSDVQEIPKVLIDRRRNKESPLPVLVVDEYGIPLQNETVTESKKPKYFNNEPILQNIEDKENKQLPFQPVAAALKSETDTLIIPVFQMTTTTTTDILNAPAILETVSSPSAVVTTLHTTELTSTISSTTELPLTTPSTTELPPSSTAELTPTTPSTSEFATTKVNVILTSELPSTTPPNTELPSTRVEPSTQASALSFIDQVPSEPPLTTISDHRVSELTSAFPSITIPEIVSTSPLPTFLDHSSILQPTELTTFPDQQSSFEPIKSTSPVSDYAQSINSDNSRSFSTLAVTTLLPNGEKPSTITQPDDQSVQASEIFSQRLSATTPMSLTNSYNQLELTTVKPVTTEGKSPYLSSNTLSSEQLQLLMKAAIARLLLQGASSNSGLPAGKKLPEVTIPHQVRLVENKSKTEEVVVFSPVSHPGTNKPTSPMPNIINALQNLIEVTKPASKRQNITPSPVESHLVASNNDNNIFSPNGPFSRFFSTSRAATNNFAIVRANNKPTTAAPTFFINLRDRSTSQLPPSTYSEVVSSRYPILPSPAPTKTWQEFNGRQNSQNNNNPLRDILMAPVNFMTGIFKAAQQIGAFMGNAFNSLTSVFNPNRSRVN